MCSFDEIGYYDLPAMMDLILSKSTHKKLFYGSQSMGGNFYSAVCSERPEYESLFAGSFHLVPSIYLPPIGEYPPFMQALLKASIRIGVSNKAFHRILDPGVR